MYSFRYLLKVLRSQSVEQRLVLSLRCGPVELQNGASSCSMALRERALGLQQRIYLHRSSEIEDGGQKPDVDGPSEQRSSRLQQAPGWRDYPEGPQYDTHIPLAGWQRAAIAIGAAVGALANPARADLVAALGETTGQLAYERMRSKMRQTPEGQSLLRDRLRVTSASVSHTHGLPPGTFGAAYADFMRTRSFEADDRPAVRFLDDVELAYVAARAREVHDFWHVLFSCPTTVTGELALKMVELVQTGLPMCGLAVLGGPLRLSPERRQLLREVYYPWALRAGMQCADLICIRYEEHFHENLGELRDRWRIVPAPPISKAQSAAA